MVRQYLYGSNAIKSYLEHAVQEKIDGELLVNRNTKHSELIDLAIGKGLKCKYVSQSSVHNKSRSQRLPQLLLYNCTTTFINSVAQHSNDSRSLISSLLTQQSSTVVLLDNITDVHNIGAIIRSATFFAIDAVVSRVKLSSLAEPTLAHISAGAVFSMPLLFGYNLHRIITQLKESGYWIIGLDHEHGDQYSDEVWNRQRIALVLGGEHSGMSSLLSAQCDYRYQITGSPSVDSLNVSVAAGIAFAHRYAACQSLVAT